MKTIIFICFVFCETFIPVFCFANTPVIRVITGTNAANDRRISVMLSDWLEEDLSASGFQFRQMTFVPDPVFFNSEKDSFEWTISQDAGTSGGVLRYRTELQRQNWKVAEYTFYSTDTNDLRTAVRTAVDRFAVLITELSPDTNTDIVSNTNSFHTNRLENGFLQTASETPISIRSPQTSRFGGLITLEGSFNISGDSNSGVIYYSGGATFQKNLFGGWHLGWHSSYDHYSISQTNLYSYRVDVWKNTMILNYQHYFPFPVFIEAGIGFGGYFGQIDYWSSSTNFIGTVLGAAVEPKAGIGIYLGDWLCSVDIIFNYSLFYFNSANYPLMGIVAGASIGRKF